jgi:hypothetical protein
MAQFVIVKASDLKPGNVIIHNSSKFVITSCGLGTEVDNEFGNYFWITGTSFNNLRMHIWSFENCPVILVIP